ncbi:hypothetical protein [Pseudomonas matsuisoli]|nr:hypothetical protein [Pseudomonas matsuisoli]
MKRLMLCSLIPLFLTGHVQASSDDAWRAYERDMRERCLGASQLKNARIAGEPVMFDDRLAVSALVINGQYPQPHMKEQRGRELCIYDRRSKTAYISEADKLIKSR